MYTMTVDGRLLYDPRLNEYALENPTLTQDGNRFASATFTIYPDNPEYGSIRTRRSIISIYDDGELLLSLRAIKPRMAMRGGITYTCEETAAMLNDLKRRPGWFQGTPAAYIAALIADFNARYTGASPSAPDAYLDIRVPLYRTTPLMTGSDVRKCQTNLVMLGYSLSKYGIDGKYGDETANAVRRFRKDNGLSGDYIFDQAALDKMIEIFTGGSGGEGGGEEEPDPFTTGTVAGISTDTATFINDDYVGYWDLMQDKLVGEYGGYIIPRYTDEGIVIDWLTEDNLPLSTQGITFGENMADLFIETDSTDTFSVLIPLGADVRATNIHEGQAKQTPLTIASVNDGKDYLEDEDGIVLYGRKELPVRWEEVKDATELKSLGQQYMEENAVRLAETIDLSVIDLRNVNANIESLKWMTRVAVESELHNLSEVYALSRKQTPLGAPKNGKIRLGATRATLTDRIANNVQRTAQAMEYLSGRVFGLENPEPET